MKARKTDRTRRWFLGVSAWAGKAVISGATSGLVLHLLAPRPTQHPPEPLNIHAHFEGALSGKLTLQPQPLRVAVAMRPPRINPASS